MVDLFQALYVYMYTDTFSCVHADACDSDWFLIGSGVRQGCVVAPDLFLTPIDWLLSHTDHLAFWAQPQVANSLTDFYFADDVTLLTECYQYCVGS